MTKASGEHGLDVLVTIDGKRLAVQAKGYEGSIGNSAVQEAYAAQGYYKCDGCAVITNSTFTRHAYDLAGNVGCHLIDGDQIPDLIAGQVRFF